MKIPARRTILHVDMDAFFASVEQRDHPEWKGKPVIVGSGPHERGVVSTCSYEARKFGVHSAMPSRTAYVKCPNGIFVPPRMERYQEVSAQAFEVFEHYSPYVEAVSVDEAFIDITGSIHLFGSAEKLGEALRAEVKRVCGVTCSVGIAANRLMAKIGSERHKPDGLTMMPTDPQEVAQLLADEPIGILWGVGPSTIEALKPYGIKTCGDLQRLSTAPGRNLVENPKLFELAFGRSEDKVYWEPEEGKSVSREYTFDEDEADRERVRERLLKLVEEVGRRFRKERRWASTIRIKVRDMYFKTFTRQMALSSPVRDDIAFRKAALKLFEASFPSPLISPVRLIGFGVANFVTSPGDGGQMRLWADKDDETREKRERLSETIDALKSRYTLESP